MFALLLRKQSFESPGILCDNSIQGLASCPQVAVKAQDLLQRQATSPQESHPCFSPVIYSSLFGFLIPRDFSCSVVRSAMN